MAANNSDAEVEPTDATAKKKRAKKGIIIPAVVLLIGLGGGGYFVLGAGKADAEKTGEHGPTTSTTALGRVVRLKPITMNLSDGHVLKVGMALQMVEAPKSKELALVLAGGEGAAAEGAADSPLAGEEAKALNAAIHTLGDMTYEELSKPGSRREAKEHLGEKLKEIYEGDVTEVYFTDFVMS